MWSSRLARTLQRVAHAPVGCLYKQQRDRNRSAGAAGRMRQEGQRGVGGRACAGGAGQVEQASRRDQFREIAQSAREEKIVIEGSAACTARNQASKRITTNAAGLCQAGGTTSKVVAASETQQRKSQSNKAITRVSSRRLSPPAPRLHRSPPQSCRRPPSCCCPPAAAATAGGVGSRRTMREGKRLVGGKLSR